MAGHSHWHNIQQAKGKADAKRAILFTRAAQQLILAAREGGGDPEHNLSLRIAVDYAKSVNMPNDSIERAIKKGAGTDQATRLEKALYEGYGPFKVPVIVLAITDNKNRTVNEIRSLFSKAGGELGTVGTVMWQFSESGRIVLRSVKVKKAEKFGETDSEVAVDREESMLELMDVPEVEDISLDSDNESQIFVKAPTNRLAQVAAKIAERGFVVVSSGQHFEATNKMNLSDSQLNSFSAFLDTLEDQQDVQKLWHAISEED